MSTLKSFLESQKQNIALGRLRRQWKKAMLRERFDDAIELASEMIEVDANRAIGWRLMASVYVRKCPGYPPNPECEEMALKYFEEAFTRDLYDRGIAFSYTAFAHWAHKDTISQSVIDRYQGKGDSLERILDGISTRGQKTNRNEATGAFTSLV